MRYPHLSHFEMNSIDSQETQELLRREIARKDETYV